MKKKLLYIILLATGSNGIAQIPAGDFFSSLKANLEIYHQNNPSIKLHLAFNQPQYSPGDTVYYKASLFSQNPNEPKRQIISVVLADRNGKKIHSQKTLLKDDNGSSQFALPANLEAGIYTVIAYSEVLKNYGPKFYHYSNLYVSLEPSVPLTTKEIRCFAEGGNFVEGVRTKLVITGNAFAPGELRDHEGTILSRFETDSSGLGVVYLTADPGKRYHVTSGLNLKSDLPEATVDGISMLTSVPVGNGTIRFVLQVNETSKLRNEKFYFAMTSQGVIYSTAELSFLDKPTLLLQVPNQNIPNGISVATIFRQDGSVVAERLCRVDHRDDARVTIKMDKTTLATRESGTFKVVDSSGGLLKSTVNISVYESDLFDNRSENDQKKYLELLSSLPYGGHESIIPSSTDFAGWDNFLITKKWERFTWKDVWVGTKNDTYAVESYLRLKGKVSYLNSDKPFPDSTRISFFLQKDITTYQTFIDKQGNFSAPILDFWNEDEVYCRVETKGKKLTDIKITWVPEETFTFTLPQPEKKMVSRYGNYSIERNEIDQSFQFFSRKDSLRKEINPHAFLEDEVTGVDARINLSDYLIFPDMEETLREVVPFVQHRKQSNKSVIRVWLDELDRLAYGDPLLIIDGIITDDTDYFMSLKPENVASIKIIYALDKLKIFGACGSNGVILVETKIFNNAANVPKSDFTFLIHGLTPSSSWKSVAHHKVSQRHPDLRAVLYWNPSVNTREEGESTFKFFTSDYTGRFKIEVDGIREDGVPVHGENWFDVQFKPLNGN